MTKRTLAVLVCLSATACTTEHDTDNGSDTTLTTAQLVAAMSPPDGVPVEALHGSDFTAASAPDINLHRLAAIVGSVQPIFPDFSSPQAAFAHVQHDFPTLSDDQISANWHGIRDLYRNAMRYLVLEAMRADAELGIEPQIFCTPYTEAYCKLCDDEKLLLLFYPEYIPAVDLASKDAVDFEREKYGSLTSWSKGNALRHAVWNVLMAYYISLQETSISWVLGWVESYAYAHESCYPNTPVESYIDKMLDLHNNHEGRDYFDSVASEESDWVWYPPWYIQWIDTPSKATMKTAIYNAAEASANVAGDPGLTEASLRAAHAGSLVRWDFGCDDGICSATESCSSCPGDCGTCAPFCGDGDCNGSETCSSCPGDCGTCPPPPPPACSESCSGKPDGTSCMSDCSGVCYAGRCLF